MKQHLKDLTLSDIFSSRNLFYFFTGISAVVSPYWEYLFKKYPKSFYFGPAIIAILVIITGICQHLAQKNMKEEAQQKRELERKYNSLLQLNEILFKHHINLIYDDIDNGNADLRVSLYLYDKSKDNFLLLSRFSKNDAYNNIHSYSQYPNKGWLNLIWNNLNGEYFFNKKAQNDKNWIKKCQQENKKHCPFSGCSAKKQDCEESLRPQNCPILSKEILSDKAMHAKNAYGIILKHYTEKIGILLVESMESWTEQRLLQVKGRVAARKGSPTEILSQFREDLLRIKSPVPDIAESIKGGKFHA